MDTLIAVSPEKIQCPSGFCAAADHSSALSQRFILPHSFRIKHSLASSQTSFRGHSLCNVASSHRTSEVVKSIRCIAGLLIEEEAPSSPSRVTKELEIGDRKVPGRKYLLGRSEKELVKLVRSLGQQSYRGRQIHQMLYKTKAKDLNDFHHLPKVLKEDLTNGGWQVGRSLIHHVAKSIDGTIKVLLKLEDNRLLEAVGIPVQDRNGDIIQLTACVSSQVGCALKCAFCATGKGGFARNLRPHEIIEQVLVIEELFSHRVTNVVFMGMGEPLMNLPALVPALRVLNKEVSIRQRMMTISSVGVPDTILELATYKLQATLAISLHAPNQQLRSQLVPTAEAYPLVQLLADCRRYFFETGRRVIFEYTLLDGVNDKQEHAEELAKLLRHWKLGTHVNLTPYNPIADAAFRRPRKAHVLTFLAALRNSQVTATVVQPRGLDANAACGQLRNDFQRYPLRST